jgi:hypothetical protein
MLKWYRTEIENLTELDRARIRGMWITLPFMYPLVRYLAVLLVEWLW